MKNIKAEFVHRINGEPLTFNGEIYALMLSSPARILRTLTRNNAFYFFTSVGNYTGQKAMSLEEFAAKIMEVETASLAFHLYRGDFERWTADVLEDLELTQKITALKNMQPAGDVLRNQLHGIIATRINELKEHGLD
jgi:hypothetical protein